MTDVRDCEACGGDGVECDNKTHDCYPCPTCEGTGTPVTYPRTVGLNITYPDWVVHVTCVEEAARDYQRCKSGGTTIHKPTHNMTPEEITAVHAMIKVTPIAVEAVPAQDQSRAREPRLTQERNRVAAWGKGANHV